MTLLDGTATEELSSAVWFDLLLTVPYGQFAITDPDDVETAVLLTVAGPAVTEIALWGRGQQSGSSTRRVGNATDRLTSPERRTKSGREDHRLSAG